MPPLIVSLVSEEAELRSDLGMGWETLDWDGAHHTHLGCPKGQQSSVWKVGLGLL